MYNEALGQGYQRLHEVFKNRLDKHVIDFFLMNTYTASETSNQLADLFKVLVPTLFFNDFHALCDVSRFPLPSHINTEFFCRLNRGNGSIIHYCLRKF